MKLYALPIAHFAGALLLFCLWNAEAARAEGPVETGASRAAGRGAAWDDRHMRSRVPHHTGSGSRTPRLILPEGSENNPLPEGKTLYATPDRSWESGSDTPARGRARYGHTSTIPTIRSGGASRNATSRSSAIRGTSMSTRR